MSQISGHTRLGMLFGSPVEHSLSPALHNTSFAQLGVDALYLVADVTEEDLPDALAGARAMNMLGLNITMPYKGSVIPLMDELTPAAQLMGAVNTVEIANHRLIGHNTDGAGMLRSIAEEGFPIGGRTITIIGAGGAGSAVFTQSALDGASHIRVFNVKDSFFDVTQDKLEILTRKTGAECTLHDLADKDELADSVTSSDIVVDATRIGMAPFEDQSNIDQSWLHPGQAVADTVYHPVDTVLLNRARAAGATPVNGLGMLLWQAAVAEKIWLGLDMPVEYVRNAVFR